MLRPEHVSDAEIGAERAANQVNGSGAVNGRGKIQWSGREQSR